MKKKPLILRFNNLEIDFSKVQHSELLEKLFKEKPVPYLATLLYFELFDTAYKNLLAKEFDPFTFIITYKELGKKLNSSLSTLSNAFTKLEEAGLIVKERLMVRNDDLNSNLSYKYVLRITLKLNKSFKTSLQNTIDSIKT